MKNRYFLIALALGALTFATAQAAEISLIAPGGFRAAGEQLIADFLRGAAARRYAHERWVCVQCGERLEGQFTACWQCGALRPG